MKNWIKIHFECGNIIYNENNGQCPNDYFTPFQESSQDIILSSSKNASSIPIAALFLYVSHNIKPSLRLGKHHVQEPQILAGWVFALFQRAISPKATTSPQPIRKEQEML